MLMRKFASVTLPNVVTDNLVIWFESQILSSYPGSGTVWTDLTTGKIGNLVNNGGADLYNSTDKTILIDQQSEFLTLENFVTIPIASDFTVSAFYKSNTKNTFANPGLCRLSNVTFFIFQSTTGRPWIRISGTDVLKPSSGYSVPDGVYVHISFVWKNGVFAKFYVDGIEKYTNNTTKVFGLEHTLTYLMANYLSNGLENLFGDYKNIMCYTKALTQEEVSFNNTNLRAFYNL